MVALGSVALCQSGVFPAASLTGHKAWPVIPRGRATAWCSAAEIGDEDAFRRMMDWSEANLAIRPDNLLAWRWQPDVPGRVADPNNASDGDLFYAWALIRGADRFGQSAWREPRHRDRTRPRRDLRRKPAGPARNADPAACRNRLRHAGGDHRQSVLHDAAGLAGGGAGTGVSALEGCRARGPRPNV